MASVIDLDRVRRNDDRLSTLQLILSGAVDLEALKEVLRVNTKVSEVIIYVDESFLVELPVEATHDLFRTIGGMPNLQKLGFHSQSGSSGVLSVQALIAITSHATRMVHFGISDVALWGSQADFQLWATQLQTQLFLQSFCVCECELLEPSKECPLDPLLTVLSILPSLEALFLQAATPNALGQVSPEAVGAIGMAPQLQDLRLGNFELKHDHMVQMARVLPSNAVLTELKLDACHEFKLETAQAMGKILKHNRRLKSLELGLTAMMSDDCAEAIAQSLHYNTSLESFTLSRGANARFRPTITKACQRSFVEMLHQNYTLETLVLFQRFPVKKEFKLYLTLNKYGRGKLLMSHSTEREQWIQAIYKVNDDLDSIFYYLSINPSLCSHCFDNDDDKGEKEKAEEPDFLRNTLLGPLYNTLKAPGVVTDNKKRARGSSPSQLVASAFLAQQNKRLRTEANCGWGQQQQHPAPPAAQDLALHQGVDLNLGGQGVSASADLATALQQQGGGDLLQSGELSAALQQSGDLSAALQQQHGDLAAALQQSGDLTTALQGELAASLQGASLQGAAALQGVAADLGHHHHHHQGGGAITANTAVLQQMPNVHQAAAAAMAAAALANSPQHPQAPAAAAAAAFPQLLAAHNYHHQQSPSAAAAAAAALQLQLQDPSAALQQLQAVQQAAQALQAAAAAQRQDPPGSIFQLPLHLAAAASFHHHQHQHHF